MFEAEQGLRLGLNNSGAIYIGALEEEWLGGREDQEFDFVEIVT